jgi:hypothetical protein
VTNDDAGELDAGGEDASTRDASAPRCGTPGSARCESGQYCELGADNMCGLLAEGGSCQPVPSGCDRSYDPVCGCDNRTYGNACSAAMASVSVLHHGLCTADECLAAGGRPTPGVGSEPPKCEEGDESWRIGRAIEPTLCCWSSPVPGATCGGIGGLRCKTGLFCNYELEAGGVGCSGADVTGTCQLVETLCTDDYMPVCGCDHRTYVNRCAAHAASASVLHEGACNERDCQAAGGTPVNGSGAAPMCPAGSSDYGQIVYTSGFPSIEGSICCVPE